MPRASYVQDKLEEDKARFMAVLRDDVEVQRSIVVTCTVSCCADGALCRRVEPGCRGGGPQVEGRSRRRSGAQERIRGAAEYAAALFVSAVCTLFSLSDWSAAVCVRVCASMCVGARVLRAAMLEKEQAELEEQHRALQSRERQQCLEKECAEVKAQALQAEKTELQQSVRAPPCPRSCLCLCPSSAVGFVSR